MDLRKFVRLNQFRLIELNNRIRIKKIVSRVSSKKKITAGERPIAFFNASTRMHYLSQNAAFSLLTSWGLSLEGKKIVHFVCQAGMKNCVLGTNVQNVNQPPPCEACQAQSKRLFQPDETFGFTFVEDSNLSNKLNKLSLDGLISFEHEDLPLGDIVLPSLRWILRRHNLIDDNNTKNLFKSYILSANNIALNFQKFIDKTNPSHLIVFNGLMYPEATAKIIAKNNNIDVITHEVGLEPLTGFFTRGEATAYPLPIPNDYQLSDSENKKLDEYLSNRFQGKFSMAGINFWSDIKSLDKNLVNKINDFDQLVPIFTNVIFDTSQKHANTIFTDMFKWLELLIPIIKENKKTLFILRAHPDENRDGKASNESVANFVEINDLMELSNLIFIDSTENISSYELISKSKFMLVYNSSIGLEGSILGKPVLSAGKARYTQYPIVTYPDSLKEYKLLIDNWLAGAEIEVSPEFQPNARKFLYFQLFKSSIPFSKYISKHKLLGYVYLNKFNIDDLQKSTSLPIQTILNGIENQGTFLIEQESE